MINFLKQVLKPSVDLSEVLKQGAVVIDVRSKGEFNQAHVQGSRNVPLDTIQKETENLKKLGKPIVTVCASGARSGMAKTILAKAGIEVYNGGSWTSIKAKMNA
jgi:phage shock protein E